MTTQDQQPPPRPTACVLTGESGENPDDCTTHGHEPDVRLAEITIRAVTWAYITVGYAELAAAWRKDQGIPDSGDGDEEYPEAFQMEDRGWALGGPLDGLLGPLLGDTADADLTIDSVTVINHPAPEKIAGCQAAKSRAENPGPDACADAMTALHDRILSMVPAGQREDAEGLLADLMDLTGENLSGAARDEVIRQALAAGPAASTRDDEAVHRIGRFTDVDKRPVEVGVDHALMTFSVSGATARLNREQRFSLHALEVAATVAIDTYNAVIQEALFPLPDADGTLPFDPA